LARNRYHFTTHWRVESTVDEVSKILGDPLTLMRWWPSVYLDVKVVEPGDERGLGRVVSLYTKGWLPYTLRWDFRVTEVRKDGFTLVAWGDFDGRGIWTFQQDGPWVNIIYDWKINAEKPLLRSFSFIMKPIFSANHHWAMAKGEGSLKTAILSYCLAQILGSSVTDVHARTNHTAAYRVLREARPGSRIGERSSP
jgi:hypothetical protein